MKIIRINPPPFHQVLKRIDFSTVNVLKNWDLEAVGASENPKFLK